MEKPIAAEASADFIHKLKIALKELRETDIWLAILGKAKLVSSTTQLAPLIKETDELSAILFASIQTAKRSRDNHAS